MRIRDKLKEHKEYYKTTALYEALVTLKYQLKNNQLLFMIAVGFVVIIGILVGPFAYKTLHWREFPKSESINSENLEDKKENANILVQYVYVTVSGEVKSPGMYKLTTDDRVNDAIIKAGGFTENAYTENINLAQKLTDEQYINVMSKDEANKTQTDAYVKTEFQGIVNINTGTVDELCQLPGIGEATAVKIIEYREQTGRFENIIDIQNVSGIGPAKYNKIKNNITI